jgi:hypothetical protein
LKDGRHNVAANVHGLPSSRQADSVFIEFNEFTRLIEAKE